MNIGLALSGGGFRATLFHLGAIRYLHEAGLLQSIKAVSAVSGGSILAAHVVVNWEQYCGEEPRFNSAAEEVIAFTQSDVRGKIIRRVLFALLTIIPRFMLSPRLNWTTTNLLQRYYDGLFSDRRLKDLSGENRPSIAFNSTSLTTGSACEFDQDGFTWYVWDGETGSLRKRHISAPNTRLSFAVACSSAFPPLFPPLVISSASLFSRTEQFPHPQYLADGGVYDNLGIAGRLSAALRAKEVDLLIICDAEGDFDTQVDTAYTNLVNRNVRASDLLMTRVSALQLRQMDVDKERLAHISIKTEIIDGRDKSLLDPEIQRILPKLRTDLDSFSDIEVDALIRHGYNCTRGKLGHLNKGLSWSWSRTLSRKPTLPSLFIGEIQSGSRRKARLWSSTDWVSWATLASVISIALLLLAPTLFSALRAADASRRATEAGNLAFRLATIEFKQSQGLPPSNVSAPPVEAPTSGFRRTEFIGQFVFEPLATGTQQIKTLQPISFRDSSGRIWTAPAGTVSDGLSIPRSMWSVLGSPFSGEYLPIAVIYDHYVQTRERSWQDTSKMLYEGLIASGVSEVKAKLLYQAVYTFGPRWDTTRASPPRTGNQREGNP